MCVLNLSLHHGVEPWGGGCSRQVVLNLSLHQVRDAVEPQGEGRWEQCAAPGRKVVHQGGDAEPKSVPDKTRG